MNAAATDVARRVHRRIQSDPERFRVWAEVMADLGLGHLTKLDLPSLEASVRHLGAGYKFACYVFTRVISVIEPRSFIVFDEPENRTHPRLLSAMMLALHRVLNNFESFALVATHSPLIVQEIPRRQVHLLRCFEGIHPHFTTPADETFGATLGELTHKVFALDHDKQNFDVLLRRLIERYGAARVRAELAEDLALSARLLLDDLDSPPGVE